MNGIKKVRITLRRDNATYKHVAVKFAKICKVMFHHLCLSNFAEKERKEKIRETERKDKGNIERVMMLTVHHIFVPDLKILFILKRGGKESGNGVRKSCD